MLATRLETLNSWLDQAFQELYGEVLLEPTLYLDSELDWAAPTLALAEAEVAQIEQNKKTRLIKAAHFPVQKELAGFDFAANPSLNKASILDLARGEYIARRETVLLIGNPGLGKTHPATALGLTPAGRGTMCFSGRLQAW